MDYIVETKDYYDYVGLEELINTIMDCKKLSYPRIYGYTKSVDTYEMTLNFDASDSAKVYRMLTTKGYVIK